MVKVRYIGETPTTYVVGGRPVRVRHGDVDDVPALVARMLPDTFVRARDHHSPVHGRDRAPVRPSVVQIADPDDGVARLASLMGDIRDLAAVWGRLMR